MFGLQYTHSHEGEAYTVVQAISQPHAKLHIVQFGRVYRYQTPQAQQKLLQQRRKQHIPVAYISEAMLENPVAETYRVGGYIINDDCGYDPPDGTPGYAFTASDANEVRPLIAKLEEQLARYFASPIPKLPKAELEKLTAELRQKIKQADVRTYA